MPVLVRIAFRNLLEHKAKSLIIGILLALGVIILVVGNSFMDTAAKGIKDTFIGNYTGDIFIAAKNKSPVSLFGVQAMGQMETTPTLPDYDRISAKLAQVPGINGITSQVTGFSLMSPKDKDDQGFALLFGIDPDSYYKLFQNSTVLEGSLLKPGEEGILISKSVADRLVKDAGWVRPKVGDTLILTGMGKAGFKIRAVPLRGIISFKTESEATSFISYVDVNTLRILNGMTLGNDEETPVTEEQKAILATTDEDELFGAETLVAPSAAVSSPKSPAKAVERKATVVDTGAWNFLLARVKNAAAAPAAVASLNAWFASEGIEAQASGWKTAAGPFAQSIDVVRVIFNIAIIIVAIVAVIIMMNTLVISVIERTGEIGTMRALGAQKSFVREMFLVETLTIAGVFGLIGMLLSFAIIWGLGMAGITASNPFLEILFAGKVLHLAVNPLSVVMSLVLVGIVAVIAHLYPVTLALKVEPVRAMQTE